MSEVTTLPSETQQQQQPLSLPLFCFVSVNYKQIITDQKLLPSEGNQLMNEWTQILPVTVDLLYNGVDANTSRDCTYDGDLLLVRRGPMSIGILITTATMGTGT